MWSHFVAGGHTGECEGRPSRESLFTAVSQHVQNQRNRGAIVGGRGERDGYLSCHRLPSAVLWTTCRCPDYGVG